MCDPSEVDRARAMLDQASSILRRQSTESGSGSGSSAPNLNLRRLSAPVSSPDRVSEMRGLFNPYNPRSRIRTLPSTSASTSSATTNRRGNCVPIPVPRFWSNRFFCLNDSQATHSPRIAMKMHLQQNGFGLEIVQIDMNSDSEAVRQAILSSFPKLCGSSSFELLRSLSGGDNKPLVRVSSTQQIPPAAYLASIIRRATVYIRPTESIPADDNEVEIMEEDAPSSTASGSRAATAPSNLAQFSTLPTPIGAASSTSVPMDAVPYEEESMMPEFRTLENFRAEKIQAHVGIQPINVRREDFATEVISVYMKGAINLYMEPNVFFVGEPGRDFGALRKEYFHEGIKAITTGKYDGRFPIFDGEMDHKLPSTNAALLRGEIFEAVGKFLVHSIMHTGVGCVGLSEALVEYLTLDSVATNTAFSMAIEDVTQYEYREALKAIEQWPAHSPDPDALKNIRDVAWECGYEDDITFDRRIMVSQHILYHIVVDKRKPQMDAMKAAFVTSGLTKFLSERPYLVSGVFPRESDLVIPTELIIQKISFTGDQEYTHLFEHFKAFIRQINLDGEKSKDILKAWTGWPFLPEGQLYLKLEHDADFIVHACTNEIVIPDTATPEEITRNMELLLRDGGIGFGTI